MGERALKRTWRLIASPPAPGFYNMALDEALSESVRAGGLPFLRFYFWEPGTLSLGRFQNPSDGFSKQAGHVPRVRRPTGGGGIWHENELTYSLACLQDDLGARGVKASFEVLCGFLLDTWNTLGWGAAFARDSPAIGGLGVFTPACFAGHEEYDILVGGKKLGGNAQRRDRETIFQHGSLPLKLNWNTLEDLFLPGFRPEPDQVTDLSSCGWNATAQELIPLLTEAFRSRLDIELRQSVVSAEEAARTEHWIRERYGNQAWTLTGLGSLRRA